MSPRALLLTGTVGVGKTTVAAAVGDRAGEPAAIQDASAVEDLRIDVTGLAVVEAASRVLEHWDV